jgi:hypothetical protein
LIWLNCDSRIVNFMLWKALYCFSFFFLHNFSCLIWPRSIFLWFHCIMCYFFFLMFDWLNAFFWNRCKILNWKCFYGSLSYSMIYYLSGAKGWDQKERMEILRSLPCKFNHDISFGIDLVYLSKLNKVVHFLSYNLKP